MKDNIKMFNQLISDISKNQQSNFSGLGLILYSQIESLPITALKKNNIDIELPIENYDEILKILLELSKINNPGHDGFHLLSKNFVLTHISQYFSTPIISNAKVGSGFGSRYMTALYGSYLNHVIATGVISNNYGSKIFIRGTQVNPIEIMNR